MATNENKIHLAIQKLEEEDTALRRRVAENIKRRVAITHELHMLRRESRNLRQAAINEK